MAPRPDEDEVPTNSANKREKPDEEPREDLPWYQRYREYLIGGVIIVIFIIVITAILASGGGDDDDDKSVIAPTFAPSAALTDENGQPVAPPVPVTLAPTFPDGTEATAAPTSFLEFIDKNQDGVAEFTCDNEPYFDRAGRLIFTSCDSI